MGLVCECMIKTNTTLSPHTTRRLRHQERAYRGSGVVEVTKKTNPSPAPLGQGFAEPPSSTCPSGAPGMEERGRPSPPIPRPRAPALCRRGGMVSFTAERQASTYLSFVPGDLAVLRLASEKWRSLLQRATISKGRSPRLQLMCTLDSGIYIGTHTPTVHVQRCDWGGRGASPGAPDRAALRRPAGQPRFRACLRPERTPGLALDLAGPLGGAADFSCRPVGIGDTRGDGRGSGTRRSVGSLSE